MRTMWTMAVVAAAVANALVPAEAFMRGGFGGGGFRGGGDFRGGDWSRTADGGFAHTSDAGGFEHGTAVGPNGVAHASDAGGAWHGTAADGDGAYHGSTYGGYYHSTTVAGGDVMHTTAYGDYYHQPAVVNSYGGCYGCGVGAWGAGAGLAVGAAAGAAVGSAAADAIVADATAPAAWSIGATVGYLPSTCSESIVYGQAYYVCGATWLKPAYGANGVYYKVVNAP